MRSISHHSASSGSAEWRTVSRGNLNFAKNFGSALTPEQRSHLKALSRDFGLKLVGGEHLGDWAQKDRNALLCQLNSYLPEKEGTA